MNKTEQFQVSVAAGKRLIAKAVINMEQIKIASQEHTVVIISGSTNGYVAEELLKKIQQKDDFSKESFLRGVNVIHGAKIPKGKWSNTDVVIEKGIWVKGKTIFDVAADLGKNDIILKGANAVQPDRKLAGIQIANPKLGTSGPILEAVLGRRVQLILPVGLEKRVFGNIVEMAELINDSSTSGTRLLPITGTIITELEAINILSGAHAELIAAGGIFGAEGSCRFAVSGTDKQLTKMADIMHVVQKEPFF
ncbi:hypothetical protein [Pectinatus frisingensis]|uniref:hypothetical protein n=1 Tax=Pectinatus frisingensis TaxID=865 RepID=UPI0018C8448B|nr:hypothetical protein [Pectinatus frisingensis]